MTDLATKKVLVENFAGSGRTARVEVATEERCAVLDLARGSRMTDLASNNMLVERPGHGL
jgi:hypothetical protein